MHVPKKPKAQGWNRMRGLGRRLLTWRNCPKKKLHEVSADMGYVAERRTLATHHVTRNNLPSSKALVPTDSGNVGRRHSVTPYVTSMPSNAPTGTDLPQRMPGNDVTTGINSVRDSISTKLKTGASPNSRGDQMSREIRILSDSVGAVKPVLVKQQSIPRYVRSNTSRARKGSKGGLPTPEVLSREHRRLVEDWRRENSTIRHFLRKTDEPSAYTGSDGVTSCSGDSYDVNSMVDIEPIWNQNCCMMIPEQFNDEEYWDDETGVSIESSAYSSFWRQNQGSFEDERSRQTFLTGLTDTSESQLLIIHTAGSF